MKIFEVFSKARREERRAALREEMGKGYFDEFKHFRDTGGKPFAAPRALAPAAAAPRFPPLEAVRAADGGRVEFPPGGFGGEAGAAPAPATLVLLAFRNSAAPFVEAWAEPFCAAFGGGRSGGGGDEEGARPPPRQRAALVELAVVESAVMRLPPFRGALLRAARRADADPAARYAAERLFAFPGAADAAALRAALGLANRLTAYALLLDGGGRVRWRGSGPPAPEELRALLAAAEALLRERKGGSAAG